jgi:hypothetical protein
MKGLAWYCRVSFALFILGCAAFAIMDIMRFSAQSVLAIAPVVYIVLTALCFGITESALKAKYDEKCWAIFSLVWSSIVVLLPILSAIASSSALAVFTVLSAGYEWTFIAFSVLMAVLFIPVVVFSAKYISRVKQLGIQ